MFGEWEVIVTDNIAMMASNIYLRRRIGERTEFLTKDGMIIRVERGGEVNKYTEKDLAFAILEPSQIQALADGLAAKGIKNNRDSVNEGKLEATRKHLEDMRSIVFKDKPSDKKQNG